MTGPDLQVTIVGSRRDAGLHRLPKETPLALALLGHRTGDEVKVHTNAGTVRFTITRVGQP